MIPERAAMETLTNVALPTDKALEVHHRTSDWLQGLPGALAVRNHLMIDREGRRWHVYLQESNDHAIPFFHGLDFDDGGGVHMRQPMRESCSTFTIEFRNLRRNALLEIELRSDARY